MHVVQPRSFKEAESGNVNIAVLQMTNSSFQNQPISSSRNHPPATPAAIPPVRERGISVLLQDISNTRGATVPHICSASQENHKESDLPCCFSRNATQLGKLRQSTTSTTSTVHELSLLQLVRESVTRSITETLAAYTPRNVSYEVQKALAINIMFTAM